MTDNSPMSTAECIHGLEVGACDVCHPRQVEPTVRPRSASTRARTAAPVTRPGKPSPGIATRTTTTRRYLVVHRDRLAELLADGPLTDDSGWRADLGEAGAFDPIRWDDARRAERGTELVVLVGSGVDPDHLELVAVANQPVRAVIADVLRDAGRSPRLVLNPSWFA